MGKARKSACQRADYRQPGMTCGSASELEHLRLVRLAFGHRHSPRFLALTGVTAALQNFVLCPVPYETQVLAVIY